MTKVSFRFYMHDPARHTQSIEDRHTAFTLNMLELSPPLGWREYDLPAAPDCGTELIAVFFFNYSTPGLKLGGSYLYRNEASTYPDRVVDDDKVWIAFAPNSQHIHYRAMLHECLPQAMRAFGGYAGHGYFGSHAVKYEDFHATELQVLQDRPGVDVNGRNNIFTLNVVQYWDAELCQRALGYGRDEVVERLTGKVPLVRPLMDGVYVVFNDNPDLTFEEFCAYNDRLKPVLGLQ